MKNKKELQFRDDEQKKIFEFLLAIIKGIKPEDFRYYLSEVKAVLQLPSLRKEKSMVETFETPFDGTLPAFKAQAQFWLSTVYMKLEESKIKLLVNLGRSFKKHNAENPPERHRKTIDYLITAMNVEPDVKKYVVNVQKEKEEKFIKEIDFDVFDL